MIKETIFAEDKQKRRLQCKSIITTLNRKVFFMTDQYRNIILFFEEKNDPKAMAEYNTKTENS